MALNKIFNLYLKYFLYDEHYIRKTESMSELYRPNDRYLSAKLVPTSADIGCNVVIMTDPYGRILGFLNIT
jgi:hypothetical protein